jgi:hypothetical protein
VALGVLDARRVPKERKRCWRIEELEEVPHVVLVGGLLQLLGALQHQLVTVLITVFVTHSQLKETPIVHVEMRMM